MEVLLTTIPAKTLVLVLLPTLSSIGLVRTEVVRVVTSGWT